MPELDHLFLFVSSEATARQMMDDAGLRVNYSRSHPGQGTRNLCACLDDVFLELIWLDGSPISPASEHISLGLRGRGKGSPIGVSWRGASPWDDMKDAIAPYNAPFLPTGVHIPVAKQSLDPNVPFVFKTPGGIPPSKRTDGLVGDRQIPHLSVLGDCEISVPNPISVASLLNPFKGVKVKKGAPVLRLTLLRSDGAVGQKLEWKSDLSAE